MKIPLLDLEAHHGPLRDHILAAIERVVDSQQFILGPEVAAFEKEVAALVGVEHAIGVSSGTDALLVTLMALGIGGGDEVVTSAYSFFATAGAIARLGARPVFVDIDPATFNIDAGRAVQAVTPRTRAILPVHLFGLSADLDPIVDLARRAGIPIVEDAAQALGATYTSRTVGTIGTAGCFSFYPTKNLGALGEAGLVTTNDRGVAHRVRLLRNHGMAPKYCHQVVGGNFRMDELQAAVLRVKLPHLEAWIGARRRNAALYERLFREAGIMDRVILPAEPPDRRHVFNQYVIRTRDRDALKRHLDERGIGSEIYYPIPFHLQPCFGHLGYRSGDFIHAEQAAAETLAVPVFAEASPQQQRVVVEAIAEFVNARAGAAR